MDDSFDFIITANQRIETVVIGVLGQVTREFQQMRNVLAVTRVGATLSRNLIAHRSQTQSALEQNLRGHRALFAQQSQQQMLGADVPMLKPIRFVMREMKNALGLGRQRQFNRSRNPFAQDCAAFDFSAD